MNPILSLFFLLVLVFGLPASAWSEDSNSTDSITADVWTPITVTKIIKSFSQSFSQEWRVINAPTGFTCSTLCGYFGETNVVYDPGQDVVLTTGENAAEAYQAAQNHCYERLLGSGKLKDKDYAILVVEVATQNGVVPARATVTNACVKN